MDEVEPTSMNQIKLRLEKDMDYAVIVNTIEFNEALLSQEELFNILKRLQKKYPRPIIQIFSTRYLINKNHLMYAIYYSLKAYHRETLISHRPSIELLLFLSASHQIREGLEIFGLSSREFNEGQLNYCIVSNNEDAEKINREFLKNFDYVEKPTPFNDYTAEKFKRIKQYFNFTDTQIVTMITTLGAEGETDLGNKEDLLVLFKALSHLVVEKMVLLSLEVH